MPRGLYVVIDHSAAAGTGLRGAAEQHRIERQAAIAAITGAGFLLDGESDVLRSPDDNLALGVFDPAVRGRTDQFMLRFRKPG
jgi:predicted methyltransferase